MKSVTPKVITTILLVFFSFPAVDALHGKSSSKTKKRLDRKKKRKKEQQKAPQEITANIEFTKRKLAILSHQLDLLRPQLKAGKNRKKAQKEIREIQRQIQREQQALRKNQARFFAKYTAKKREFLQKNKATTEKYDALRYKKEKTAKDLKLLKELAKAVSSSDVVIDSISNMIKKSKLRNLYEHFFFLKRTLKSLFDVILHHEMALRGINDYYRQYDLESKINQAYAEAITVENQLQLVQKKISEESLIYLHKANKQIIHLKSLQVSDHAKYLALKNELRPSQSRNRTAAQLRASQDRLAHMIKRTEQDLAFLNNPTRTSDERKKAASSEQPTKFTLNTPIYLIIGLYKNQLTRSQLLSLKNELIKDQERLKKNFDSGRLNYEQVQHMRHHDNNLRILLDDLAKKVSLMNQPYKDPVPPRRNTANPPYTRNYSDQYNMNTYPRNESRQRDYESLRRELYGYR